MSSTIFAARRALHRLLQEAAPIDAERITHGFAGNEDDQAEAIAVAGVFNAREEEAGLGGNRKAEEFEIELVIKLSSTEATVPEIEERADEVREAIRGIVHGVDRNGDRTLDGALGGSGVASALAMDFVSTATPLHGGGAIIIMRQTVQCRARG